MLSQFPRPPQDNGRGVHWSPNQYLWGKEDWGFWKEQLQAMNIKWVKLLDDGSGSAMGLVKRLIDIQVMPVIRYYKERPNPGHISAREADMTRRFVEVGGLYFETNNEPDLELEWKNRKRPANWLDIVVNNFIIEADMIREAGGYLLFPAFGPGGRGNPFKMIVDKGRKDLLDGNCCLAIHNYCLGRPLDYPNDPVNTKGQPLTLKEWTERGGMWAWEMSHDQVNEYRRQLANPNANIMEDSTCFRAYEYFDALVNEAVGHSIPILTTEGGYNVGQRAGTTFGDDARYPKPTPEWTGRLTDDMFRSIENGPDYYFACMPWIIAVGRMGVGSINFETQGPWFTHLFDKEFGLNGELPVVAMLKARPGKVRHNGPLPAGMAGFYTGPDLTGREFDDRLKYLEPQVELEPVADPTKAHWRLIEVRWADEKEAAGKAYAYVKVLDENGEPMEGAFFHADRGDAVDRAETKGRWDDYWGNYLLTGLLGTYKISMDQDRLPSDKLLNVGMGTEDAPRNYIATSFFLTFQKVPGRKEELSQPSNDVVTEPVSAPAPIPVQPVAETEPQPGPAEEKIVTPPEPVPPAPIPAHPILEKRFVAPAPPPIQTTPAAPVPSVAPETVAAPPDVTVITESLTAAARRYIYPINRKSALYLYAQTNKLGDFLSAEFPLRHEGVEYRGQVFEKGIVYMRFDEPGSVTHIPL